MKLNQINCHRGPHKNSVAIYANKWNNQMASRKPQLVMHKNRKITPRSDLVHPLSPHERRLMEFSRRHSGVPAEHSLEGIRLKKLMAMDIALQSKLREMEKRLPHLMHARMKSGSGMQQANHLRSYFLEYNSRYHQHGPNSLPSSFNVAEAFLRFDKELMYFDLREEIEHLLSVNDYFRWYKEARMPNDLRLLKDIMKDGTVYSFDMVSDEGSFRISESSSNSVQVIAGVSLVRHEDEVSAILLAGDNPPYIPNDQIKQEPAEPGRLVPEKEGLKPHPDLTTRHRYLDGYPDFGRVVLLTRFNIGSSSYDVRYINIDTGNMYAVVTDDLDILLSSGMPRDRMQEYKQWAANGFANYQGLFSALASLIYLPAYYAAVPERICEFEVATEIRATSDERSSRETLIELGEAQCPSHRKIKYLPAADTTPSEETQITPPEMKFQTDGYWKHLNPQELGEDKSGNAIFGRTWVSRHESWSAKSPEAFTLRAHKEPTGPDPGIVYVQRSAALEVDVYKIGLTRRNAEVRASELSSATGVPLPFAVLATWRVGDCARVERKVHELLAAFRLNPRREFFRLELSKICKTIQHIIDGTL